MVKNDSVKKLQTIRTIYKVFFIVLLACVLVLGIIAATTMQGATAGTIAGMIVGTILGDVILAIAGYIGLCFFDYFINKRQENIDYMNARLEHLNSKSSKKEAK